MASRVRRHNPGIEEDAVILGVGVVVVIVAANVLSSGAVNRALGQAALSAAGDAARAYPNYVSGLGVEARAEGYVRPGHESESDLDRLHRSRGAENAVNSIGALLGPSSPGYQQRSADLAQQRADSPFTAIANWITGLFGGQSTTTPRTGLEAGTRDSGYTDSSGQRWKQGYQ